MSLPCSSYLELLWRNVPVPSSIWHVHIHICRGIWIKRETITWFGFPLTLLGSDWVSYIAAMEFRVFISCLCALYSMWCFWYCGLSGVFLVCIYVRLVVPNTHWCEDMARQSHGSRLHTTLHSHGTNQLRYIYDNYESSTPTGIFFFQHRCWYRTCIAQMVNYISTLPLHLFKSWSYSPCNYYSNNG